MSTSTPTTVTVRIDPNATSLQSDVIGPATPFQAGAMTAAQAAKLAGINPGGVNTLKQDYDAGTSAADQTLSIAAAKGGPVLFKAAAVAVGSLLRGLTSVSAVLFDVVDAAIPKVLAVGTFIQNDPGFGSPVMGSQTPDGFMSYTSDGVGGSWGGTGMTAKADAVTPANAAVRLTVNDVTEVLVASGYMVQPIPTFAIPAALPIVTNVITPTLPVHYVGAGLIKTITPPAGAAVGSQRFTIIPTAAFTYDNTGNIKGGGGLAIVDRPMDFTWDGTHYYPSY